MPSVVILDQLNPFDERRHDDHDHKQNLSYHEAQIRYGPFRFDVLIYSPIDREAVTARYENGFLWVNLPKLLENKLERAPIQRSMAKE